MPKYILVLGANVKVSDAELNGIVNEWYRTSDPHVIAVDSHLSATKISEEFSERMENEERDRTHIVCRVAGGSYFGFHDGELWDFLARKREHE